MMVLTTICRSRIAGVVMYAIFGVTFVVSPQAVSEVMLRGYMVLALIGVDRSHMDSKALVSICSVMGSYGNDGMALSASKPVLRSFQGMRRVGVRRGGHTIVEAVMVSGRISFPRADISVCLPVVIFTMGYLVVIGSFIERVASNLI